MSQPDLQPGPQPPNPPPGGSGLGCALFAIGMLFLLPSGLCTTIGIFSLGSELISNPSGFASDMSDIWMVAVPTLICLAIGIALVWGGMKARRG